MKTHDYICEDCARTHTIDVYEEVGSLVVVREECIPNPGYKWIIMHLPTRITVPYCFRSQAGASVSATEICGIVGWTSPIENAEMPDEFVDQLYDICMLNGGQGIKKQEPEKNWLDELSEKFQLPSKYNTESS